VVAARRNTSVPKHWVPIRIAYHRWPLHRDQKQRAQRFLLRRFSRSSSNSVFKVWQQHEALSLRRMAVSTALEPPVKSEVQQEVLSLAEDDVSTAPKPSRVRFRSADADTGSGKAGVNRARIHAVLSSKRLSAAYRNARMTVRQMSIPSGSVAHVLPACWGGPQRSVIVRLNELAVRSSASFPFALHSGDDHFIRSQ